jgi:ubiquinone/menaquinone biosynthesis C-methylase UbiE
MRDTEPEIRSLLERAGIRSGESVVDFGCGAGTYTLAAAAAVGNEGRVYALEKDGKKLNKLAEKARLLGFQNIVEKDTGGRSEIDLASESVHAVLLFDVLHIYFFPREKQRERILDEVYRVLKDKGILILSPTHMNAHNLSKEVERRGFRLKSKHTGRIIHNEKREESSILVFAKTPRNGSLEQRSGRQNLGGTET